MPPNDRRMPRAAVVPPRRHSLEEFSRAYPDDDACLEYLWRHRHAPDGLHALCPRCSRERVFRRYATGRPCWTCTACGHHVHPTAGTIFHRSTTPLRLWFYAMHLTRRGASARQLEREIGVTYKTAWRMRDMIRQLPVEDGLWEVSGGASWPVGAAHPGPGPRTARSSTSPSRT